MSTEHGRRCPTSLIIREMQTKTTARYHITSIMMTTVKRPKAWETENNRCGEDVEKWGSRALWVGMKNHAAHVETSPVVS